MAENVLIFKRNIYSFMSNLLYNAMVFCLVKRICLNYLVCRNCCMVVDLIFSCKRK